MGKLTTFFLILSCCLVLGGCSEAELTYTIDEIDGVRHIHNLSPQWGDEVKIDLELVQQIGGLDAEDENFQFYRPSDVAVDSKGNIYVLDAGNFRVQKFTADGEFLLSFGNKGQGPGEFSAPSQMRINQNDQIYVGDRRNATLNVFGEDGELLDTIKKEAGPVQFVLFRNGNMCLYAMNFVLSDKKEESKLLQIIDTKGTVLHEFGERRQYEDNFMMQIGNSFQMDIGPAENIYLSFGSQNRIEIYNPEGKLLTKITRTLPYEESNDAKTERIGDNALRLQYNRFSAGAQVDNKKRIWVESFTRQETEEDREKRKSGEAENLRMMEIYDQEGILLGRMQNDIFKVGRSYRIIGDKIYIIDYGEESAIFEYRIVEK